MNFRKLKAEDIEVRIATVKEKGLSLLLYKTARTDAKLLDEEVGAMNWSNDFKIVDGVLYGGISVYSTEKRAWITKWDAGTESYTEKEKGRASDAFKRAGFKWGIGRELYTAPFIWVAADKVNITEYKGKLACFDRFYVSKIDYTDDKITTLEILNDKHELVFSMGKKKRPTKTVINKKIKEAKIKDQTKLFAEYEVEKYEDLSDEQAINLESLLDTQILLLKKQEENKGDNTNEEV